MTEYHVGREQQQLGKFTEEQIREGLFNGRFLKTDLLWSEGMSGWKPLSEVLSDSSDSTPPPAEPPSAAEPSVSPAPAVPAADTTPTFTAPAAPPYSPPPGSFTPPASFGGIGPGTAAVGVRPTSGTAIASLVLGVVSLPGIVCYVGLFTGIAGIICGHLALGSIKRSGQTLDGKGLAIAGLVLNYLSVLIAAVMIAFVVMVMVVGANEMNTAPNSTTPIEWPATPTPAE